MLISRQGLTKVIKTSDIVNSSILVGAVLVCLSVIAEHYGTPVSAELVAVGTVYCLLTIKCFEGIVRAITEGTGVLGPATFKMALLITLPALFSLSNKLQILSFVIGIFSFLPATAAQLLRRGSENG